MTKKVFVLFITLSLVLSFSTSIYCSTYPEVSANTIKIYYPNGDWKYDGVIINVPVNEKDTYLYAINGLLNNMNKPDNCYDEIPPDVKINFIKIKDYTAFVDIDSSIFDKIDNVNYCMDVILDILSYNILSFENVENINYTFSGKVMEKYANVKEAGFFGFSKKIKSNEEIVKRTAEIKKKFNGVNIDMTARTTTTTYNPDVSVIVIDPGHGGSEIGAVGTYLGSTYYEKYFNMDIANSVKNELQYYGYTVYMTRTSDAYVSLTSRYTLANNVGADAFISIHCNSNDDTNVRGTTCLYPNNHDIDWSQDMALWVHSFTTYTFPACGIPYMDVRNLAVLRGTTMPAIITETGFMSNQTDMSILTNSSSRTSIGYMIALGVRDWDLFGEY
jgi:N-acetylmuramoyl-L-alanine amidase